MGALGRVLAEPIVSRATIPPWPNSSMDGYAVRAQDTTGEPVELAVVGKIIAGAMPSRPLRAGESMRIFTGAPLPERAAPLAPHDAVAPHGHPLPLRPPIPPRPYARPA